MPLVDELKRRWGLGQPTQAAPQAAQGPGIAGAMQILQSRPYQLHVQESKAMGQQPMSPEQFAQLMQGQNALLKY